MAMRLRMLVTLLCAAALALACAPAPAYQIEAEGILNNPDWVLKVPTTAIPAGAVAEAGYASGNGALRIIDNINSQKIDIHAPDNIEDVIYTTTAAGTLNGTATAVFRIKATADYPFSGIAGTYSQNGWERNIVLSFSDGSTWKRCVGLAIRPDGAMVTNTTSNQVYGGIIPVNNMVWHTWTIVATGVTADAGTFDLYLDGVQVIASWKIPGSTDTAIGYVDGLSVMAGMGGSNRDGTGSWLFDRVAYKAGADPTWKPWGEQLGTVSGVISKAGSPSVKVANAVVALNSGQKTTSGAGGAYSFAGVEPNPCKVTASADDYFSRSAMAPVTFAAPAATKNLDLVALPTSGKVVYDTFASANPDTGLLVQTEDQWHYPWNTGGETADWSGGAGGHYVEPSTPALQLNAQATHGVSVDNFLPANVDFSADLWQLMGSNWAGISYRQTLPCTFDIYNGQAGADAGYVVLCYATGKKIDLWRNGAVASVPVNIDWNSPHKVRVIAYGNYHEVQIDGTRIISAVDSGKLSGGYTGLLRDATQARYGNFKVSELYAGSSLGTVSGSVYNAAAPSTKAAGALVLLSDGRYTFADANGDYSIGLTSFDELTVAARAAGYLDKSTTIQPALGANTVNFALNVDSAYKASINAAKAAAVNSPVAISGKVITATWSGTTIYVEEPSRVSGIKVTLPASDPLLGTKTGKSVDVRGTLRADAQTGELYIEASSVFESPVAASALLPLYMNGRSVLDKASGANVTGLYAKVSGKVKAVNSPTDYTIDDGSGDLKVIVGPGFVLGTWPAVDDSADVEGIVSLDGATPAAAVRCVRRWK